MQWLAMLRSAVLLLGFLCWSASNGRAQDWPRFRGPNGTGISDATNLVSEFGPEKNVVWKVDAEAGTSSPIIVKNRLFYSSFQGDLRSLHCLDGSSGQTMWTASVTKKHDEIATPPNDPATSTPVCDGNHVVVFFPDFGVAAFTADGRHIWSKEYAASSSMHGLASSLVIVDGKVIHVVDQLKDSYIVAYDVEGGNQIWRVDRVSGLTGAFATPAIFRPADGAPQIVVTGPLELATFQADTGQKVWWITGKSNAPISSPVVLNDRIYFCEPVGAPIPFSMVSDSDKDHDGKLSLAEVKDQEAVYRLIRRIDDAHDGNEIVDATEWNDAFGAFEGRGGLLAVDPNGTGDVTSTQVTWSITRSVPYIPCVLVYRGVLYLIQDGGILATIDPATGDIAKRARLKSAAGQYYASPVAADGKVFLTNTKGDITVLRAGSEWEVLATNRLDAACVATPAIGNGRLFIRTKKTIFCIGKSPPGSAYPLSWWACGALVPSCHSGRPAQPVGWDQLTSRAQAHHDHSPCSTASVIDWPDHRGKIRVASDRCILR